MGRWRTVMEQWRDALSEVERLDAAYLQASGGPEGDGPRGSAHHRLHLSLAQQQARTTLERMQDELRRSIQGSVAALHQHPTARRLSFAIGFLPYPKGRDLLKPMGLVRTGPHKDAPWIALHLARTKLLACEPEHAEEIVTTLMQLWDTHRGIAGRGRHRTWEVRWGKGAWTSSTARDPEGAALKSAILRSLPHRIAQAPHLASTAEVRAVLRTV